MEVDQPHMLKVYNTHMGGVDLIDNLVSCYAIHTRTKKWYWCTYNWFLNVQMVQAWRLYRRIGRILGLKDREKIPLLDFMRSCVELLAVNHGESMSKTVLPSVHLAQNRTAIRYDNIGHLIIRTDKRNVCQGCKARCIYRCRKCDVGLCANCFASYHLV